MEELLHLFNTLWFERGVLSGKNPTEEKTGDGRSVDLDRPALKVSHGRSSSDQNIQSLNMNMLSEADSPNSVLRPTPKLQTILSGKEVGVGFGELEGGVEERGKKVKVVGRGRGKKCRRSKSLTELEFEEVKGFMDLGFAFSEEDHKDSSLVSMIPGLQRQGHQNGGVSRPYLSEAWRRCERREKKLPRVSLRVGGGGGVVDDLEMKNQIKFWAHSVASAVR